MNGAVQMSMLPSAVPLDFLPHHPHSRSGSVSSVSSHSSSRPHSSQGHPLLPVQSAVHDFNGGVNIDLYRSAYTHTRHSSSSTAFSTDLASPADSPPSAHALASSAAGHPGSLKSGSSGLRQTHIRAARVATSPYPRDAESVYSSSSENEDMSLFFSNPSPPDYTQMYIQSQHGSSVHAHQHQHEHISTIGQFGRMTLGPDHALEQLAANVRAATTTSASDRAKQIFVQAWYVSFCPFLCVFFAFFFRRDADRRRSSFTTPFLGVLGSMRTTLLTQMETYRDRDSTCPIAAFVISTESLTSTPRLWERQFVCVFPR